MDSYDLENMKQFRPLLDICSIRKKVNREQAKNTDFLRSRLHFVLLDGKSIVYLIPLNI